MKRYDTRFVKEVIVRKGRGPWWIVVSLEIHAALLSEPSTGKKFLIGGETVILEDVAFDVSHGRFEAQCGTDRSAYDEIMKPFWKKGTEEKAARLSRDLLGRYEKAGWGHVEETGQYKYAPLVEEHPIWTGLEGFI